MEYVHDRNIISRDVKPSNILLTENGEPLLTDFGLVKIFGEKGRDTTSLTGSGEGLGTPDYMAPEQWTGEATAQSDLYSLGVVLYEMITGRRPYKADTPAGIPMEQASEPLPLPTSYIPDLPKGIESVLLKVLAKDPENRYVDTNEFVNELENLLAGSEASTSTIQTKRLREQMTGTQDVHNHFPTGTVTFLFTDIENSTEMAQRNPEKWDALQERHHEIFKSAIAPSNGYIFQLIGDAFCVAFHTAGDAVQAAITAQVDLHAEDWGDASIKVRMGIHTGQAKIKEDGDYSGYLAMSRVQSLMSAGHGGQVLLSLITQELVCDELQEGIALRDLGEGQL